MDWKIRKLRGELDIHSIANMSFNDRDVLIPYTMNPFTIRGYRDQFIVAEDPETFGRLKEDIPPILGGAVHFVPNDNSTIIAIDKIVSFLTYIKQVPDDIVDDFMSHSRERTVAMIGQVICPGKGSFYAILEEAKKQFDEIWCYMSINGPSYKSYRRYGFDLNMDNVREFWNIYKCNYSTFVLGKWIKG